jgi:hypothetical protein
MDLAGDDIAIAIHPASCMPVEARRYACPPGRYAVEARYRDAAGVDWVGSGEIAIAARAVHQLNIRIVVGVGSTLSPEKRDRPFAAALGSPTRVNAGASVQISMRVTSLAEVLEQARCRLQQPVAARCPLELRSYRVLWSTEAGTAPATEETRTLALVDFSWTAPRASGTATLYYEIIGPHARSAPEPIAIEILPAAPGALQGDVVAWTHTLAAGSGLRIHGTFGAFAGESRGQHTLRAISSPRLADRR